jgi:hypothetical protein
MTNQDASGHDNTRDGCERGEHEQGGPSPDADVTARCVEITERYRAGTITKVSAILELQTTIPHEVEETYLEALAAYLRVLDNFKRIRERVIPGGESRNREDDGEPGDDGGDEQENIAEPNKCQRTQSTEPDDGSTKRKIDPSTFAWVIRDGIDPPSLSPSLLQTQAILENFSRDPKFAKTSLLNSSRLPQFPDSEWTNLISGKAVDLDHVLAGQYSVAHDERRTERIGDLEFIVGSAKPARVVDSHGKWVIAWDQSVDATTYVFPHRSSELRDYGRYISQLFACFPDSLHSRVIQYDRAVRIRVAQRRDLLLTDYNRFSDLHVLWIQNAGTGGKSGESEKRGRAGVPGGSSKHREACRRWNEGRCPNTVANCNFAHVCAKCRSNAHTSAECKL